MLPEGKNNVYNIYLSLGQNTSATDWVEGNPYQSGWYYYQERTATVLDSIKVTINSTNSEMKFRTNKDVSAFRDFYVEAIPRYEKNKIDYDYVATYTAGDAASEVLVTTSKKYGVLKNGSMSFSIPCRDGNTKYSEVHVDLLLLRPTGFKTDDLVVASDYFASITMQIEMYTTRVTQKRKGTYDNYWGYYWSADYKIVSATTPVLAKTVLVPVTVSGYYGTESPSGAGTYQFNVEAASLASYYKLDSSDTSSYQTVGTVKFYTSTSTSKDATPAYAIGIGANSTWDTSGTFQFAQRNGTKTIPYLVRLVGTDSSSASLPSISTAGLSGDETTNVSITNASDPRYLVLSQVSEGSDNENHTHYRYKYEGNIMIKVPGTDKTGWTAGLYDTTIYVFLITR
jgi:hypothetical protein